MFERALAGEVGLQEMFDYYLGWLANGGSPADHFDFLDADTVPFAREWGMEVALKDARTVVRAASRKGARGHPRRPLARRLADRRLRGLGLQRQAGLQGRRRPGADRRRPARQLRRLRPRPGPGADRRPRDRQPVPRPARDRHPRGRRAVRRGRRRLRARSTRPATRDGAAGLPAAAGRVQAAGRRSPTGRCSATPSTATPRPTRSRCCTSTPASSPRAAIRATGSTAASPRSPASPRPSARSPSNAVEWYFPRRLTIDTNGANELRAERRRQVPRPAAHAHEADRRADLRLPDRPHRRRRAATARSALVKRAETTKAESMLVNGAPQQSHLDPLTAAAEPERVPEAPWSRFSTSRDESRPWTSSLSAAHVGSIRMP